MIIFKKVAKKLKDFFHNTLDTAHNILGGGLVLATLVLWGVYAMPILPVICYALVAFLAASIAIEIGHSIVNFVFGMFNHNRHSGREVAESRPNAPVLVVSSTSTINAALNKNPTNETVADKTTVAKNDETIVATPNSLTVEDVEVDENRALKM